MRTVISCQLSKLSHLHEELRKCKSIRTLLPGIPKKDTYLNKLPAQCCNAFQVCITFRWTPDGKGLNKFYVFENFFHFTATHFPCHSFHFLYQ